MMLKSCMIKLPTRQGLDNANDGNITHLNKSLKDSKTERGMKHLFSKLLYRQS